MTGFWPENGTPGPKPQKPKFDPGQIVATPGVVDSVSQDEIVIALNRHLRGDWGNVCAEDSATNDEALSEGERLLSSYQSKAGIKFWIITERDRSVTTFLLTDEY